ncbi:MAG: hypothetical protein MIO90_04820, partial [Methanomassiliicoccales archaeon]|nr:hypothetical protein [Methanomassiliicoccales archaeon]
EAVKDKCARTCKDFLNDELPDLANQYLARYLAVQIETDMPDTAQTIKGEYRVVEECDAHQCVRVLSSQEKEHSMVILGLNLSRRMVEEAVERLKGSGARERLLVYLFSFESVGDEEVISQAIMEAELLGLVRDTGIVVFFAMLDARAGMGMMARIDGDMRTIEYLPH